jgi:hypothetical protein
MKLSKNSGPRSILHGQRGQALILTAAMLPLLIGVTGLAVDVGMLYHHKRRMQTAADAAAMAGGSEMMRNRFTQIVPSGRAGSTTNGFAHGGNTTVNVYHPPITGFYVGNVRYVEVQITQPSPTYFMQVFGWDEVSIVARAVAGAGANGDYCIYVLDPSMAASFEGTSSGHLDANCGVMINSTSSTALDMSSSARIDASQVSITGNYVITSSAVVDPTPDIQVPAVPDPLAHLPAPTVGSCDHMNFMRNKGTHVLSPGVYCGGIRTENDARLVLSPGIYIMHGGGFTTTSSSQVDGTEVMIYLTGSNLNPKSTYGYVPVNLHSTTQVRLSAPKTGPYAGILFFQDRSMAPDVANTFESFTDSWFEGSLYFSTQILKLSAKTTLDARYTIIVARVLDLSSTSHFIVRSDFGQLAGGSPIKKLSLVE